LALGLGHTRKRSEILLSPPSAAGTLKRPILLHERLLQ
jgi:hypothetical protein